MVKEFIVWKKKTYGWGFDKYINQIYLKDKNQWEIDGKLSDFIEYVTTV